MPFIHDYEGLPVVTTPPCVHLRNKAMYVHGTLVDGGDYPEDTNVPYCWCNLTQHMLGNDGQYVTRQDCVPGRECYKETY
jgi:hypothetical protein